MTDDGTMSTTPVLLWSKLQQFRRHVWESGLTCAFLASIIFSLSALQVKLTGGRVPVLELCLVRSCISFCTSVTVGTASRMKPLFGHRQRLPLLFLRGLFGTAAISCSYVAILNLPMGDSATLSQLRPPAMAVMGHLLLGEHMSWLGAGGCLISVVGAAIVSHPPFLFGGHTDWGQHRLLGTLCGIASPLFGSGAGYCIRRIQKQEPALVVALWFHIVTISLLVWPLLAGWPQAAVLVAPRDAVLLLGISCSSFCAQLLMTRAFQLLPAARASALSFLGVVYAHVWGALVFSEKLTVFTLGGGLLIFAGVLVVTLTAHNSSKAAAGSRSGTSSAEDPEAAVPLKAAQQQEQQQELQEQQQQQQQDLDTAPKGADQAHLHRTAEVKGQAGGAVSDTMTQTPDMSLQEVKVGDHHHQQQQHHQQEIVQLSTRSGECSSHAAHRDGPQTCEDQSRGSGPQHGPSWAEHVAVREQVEPPLLPPPALQQDHQRPLLPASGATSHPTTNTTAGSSTTGTSSSSSSSGPCLELCDSGQLQQPLLSYSHSSCSSGVLTPLGSFTQGN